jgi:hypothetical protein
MQTKKQEADTQQVSAFIQALEPGIREVVAFLRKTLLAAHPLIGERIKWNNPSFYFTGELKDFDPKTYKRDIAVFNLFKGRIMLVFPSGVNMNDVEGILEGNYPDGRRMLLFKDMGDARKKAGALTEMMRSWVQALH